MSTGAVRRALLFSTLALGGRATAHRGPGVGVRPPHEVSLAVAGTPAGAIKMGRC